ncbi:hypothetical protein GCM10011611_15150 [Aliidongia dinghuensis]|uniref:Uncharacterized protein n=1 Tax=Aliidongia dinghuensis TaxID=1867774 RepID=A0A8J3E1B8_9PROT|nr:hypothetical protein [Aliidongia dinghuensis]GGF10514.1 hypothetical protein GCM10011611_15150 [Aliidongia dinghuensis]
MAMSQKIRSAALFAGCFLISTYGIGILGRLTLPPPDVAELTDKIQAMAPERASVDTVAVGSSRMLHAFNPDRFDQTAGAAGCPVHSYNLGIGGLNLIEMRYVLRQLAAQHPPHLARVLFDPPNDIHIQFENLKSERVWVTTDPREASVAVADILSHPDPRKYSSLARYMVAFLYHNSALGLVSRYLQPAKLEAADTADAPRRGYSPLDPAAAPTVERVGLLRDGDKFLTAARRLQDAAAERAAPSPIDAAQEARRIAVIRGLANHIRGLGYEPILMSLPDTYGESITDARDLERAFDRPDTGLPVVNFMDKADAGIIYAPSSWYDWGHLTETVADYVSMAAAERLCRKSGLTLASAGQ